MKNGEEIMIEQEFTFEIYKESEQYFVYIGTESGSGVKYLVNSYKEVGEKVFEYLENYYSED